MRPNLNKQSGFTLIELMITLSVAAVLLAIGAPSFNETIASARIRADYNRLVSAMHLARSEAVKRNINVSVCARGSDSTCGQDWKDGWLVFTDDGATPNVIDAGEVIMQINPPLMDGTTLNGRGSMTRANASYADRTSIRFGPRGNSNWRGGGTVWLCDRRQERSIKAANIGMSGSLRRVRKDANDEYISAWGDPLDCGGTP